MIRAPVRNRGCEVQENNIGHSMNPQNVERGRPPPPNCDSIIKDGKGF